MHVRQPRHPRRSDQPSPESTRLAESFVHVEFIGDLFTESGIPKDPMRRTPARFFIEGVSSTFFPPYFALQLKTAPAEDFYKAAEYIQSLLLAEGFAVGEYSMADIAITAFVACGRMLFANDIGAWKAGEGPKIWESIRTGKLAWLEKYLDDLLARASYKEYKGRD